jgi:hypothetical protein
VLTAHKIKKSCSLEPKSRSQKSIKVAQKLPEIKKSATYKIFFRTHITLISRLTCRVYQENVHPFKFKLAIFVALQFNLNIFLWVVYLFIQIEVILNSRCAEDQHCHWPLWHAYAFINSRNYTVSNYYNRLRLIWKGVYFFLYTLYVN